VAVARTQMGGEGDGENMLMVVLGELADISGVEGVLDVSEGGPTERRLFHL